MIQQHLATMTDLYQLTMAAGYYEKQFEYNSTFELFVRKFPQNRSFLVASGIQSCLEYLQNLKFTDEEINFIRNHPSFSNVSEEFFEYLKEFRFTGDVNAMEEGTIYFPNEPVIQITAPTIQAQLVETYLLSMFNFQSLIASKAARIVEVAQDKKIIEFGTRRAHSAEAGLYGARSAYVGGCEGTSNVLAGLRFDIPIFGTMAHSWVMAYEKEEDAYDAYTDVFPGANALLIDTYDTVEAAKKIARFNYDVQSVRLDSGDIEKLSKDVRRILDEGGKQETKILASGDLNEYKIQELLQNASPIDFFGVGTELSTSKDAPALAGVYKLVQQELHGRVEYKAKFSEDKHTYPAKKQVYRFFDDQGKFDHDVIAVEDELDYAAAEPLLTPAIREGKILNNYDMNLNNARQRCLESLCRLPEKYKQLIDSEEYNVEVSSRLKNLTEELRSKYLQLV
jgi:nicotinate phosphoribosyltransferase